MDIITAIRMWIAGIRHEMRARRREALVGLLEEILDEALPGASLSDCGGITFRCAEIGTEVTISGKGISVHDAEGLRRASLGQDGSLRAWTKAFDIPHPTRPGDRLVHGSLEGPENGVYVRGSLEVEPGRKETVRLPDYWQELVDFDYQVFPTVEKWTDSTLGCVTAVVDQTQGDSFRVGVQIASFGDMNRTFTVNYLVIGSRKDAPLAAGIGTGGS